ncbi:hypothetical protein M0R45_024365 [Rubus argutus]|uniref:Uncharacterized protein n=1 Tax=Rubus argutus TaxID=59490 RepID=A0AAW1WQY1_RUBAR
MPSWWRKSSSKEVKKKENKESFIDTIMTIHRKLKSSSEEKFNSRSGGSRRRCSDTVSEMGSQSRALSPLTSTQVSRCQSFAERPQAQPLPLPRVQLSNIGRSDSAVNASSKPGADPTDAEGDIATASISSDSSIDSDDPSDSRLLSPMASDCEYGNRTTVNSPSRVMQKDQFPNVNQKTQKRL